MSGIEPFIASIGAGFEAGLGGASLSAVSGATTGAQIGLVSGNIASGLTSLGTLTGAASLGLEAVGGFAQANENARIAAENARKLQEQASQARKDSEEERRRFLIRVGRLRGSNRAAFVSGGVRPGQGSPLLLDIQTALEGGFEADLIRKAGILEERALTAGAAIQKRRVGLQRRQGFATLLGGALKIGSLLSGSSATRSVPRGAIV